MLVYYLNEFKIRFFFILYSFIFNSFFCFLYLKEILYISIKPISNFNGFNFIFTELSNAFLCYIDLIITVILVCRGRRLRWRPPLDRSI